MRAAKTLEVLVISDHPSIINIIDSQLVSQADKDSSKWRISLAQILASTMPRAHTLTLEYILRYALPYLISSSIDFYLISPAVFY